MNPIHSRRILTVICLLVALFFALPSMGQCVPEPQKNPCSGDYLKITKATPEKQTFTVQRRDCDLLLTTYDRYQYLEVALRQNDSLKAQSLRYTAVVERNVTLRDSIDQLQRGFIQKQDTTIAQYQSLNAKYQQLAGDYNVALEKSIDLAKDYDRKLTWQKLKAAIFTVGGVAAGVLVGVLLGK